MIGSTEEAIRVIWIEVAMSPPVPWIPGSSQNTTNAKGTQIYDCYITSGITLMEKGKSRKDNQKYQAKSSSKTLCGFNPLVYVRFCCLPLCYSVARMHSCWPLASLEWMQKRLPRRPLGTSSHKSIGIFGQKQHISLATTSSINQSINQSNNQSTNQSINQSINQSTGLLLGVFWKMTKMWHGIVGDGKLWEVMIIMIISSKWLSD